MVETTGWTGALTVRVLELDTEAEAQVARYASDQRLVPLLARGQALEAGSLVFVGAQAVYFRPASAPSVSPSSIGIAMRMPLSFFTAALASLASAGCIVITPPPPVAPAAPAALIVEAAPAATPPEAASALDEPSETGAAGPAARAAAPEEPACSDGRGCSTIGRHFEMGEGGKPQDATKALGYYLKACDFGDPTGCNNVGYMTLNGIGGAADGSRGLAYLQKGCELGSGAACHNLGYAYENAQGVGRDMAVAVEMFRRACKLGQASGCRALGLCFHYGLGLQLDRTQASLFLRKGCEGGDSIACKKLEEIGEPPP